jgi:hypothetical protein
MDFHLILSHNSETTTGVYVLELAIESKAKEKVVNPVYAQNIGARATFNLLPLRIFH